MIVLNLVNAISLFSHVVPVKFFFERLGRSTADAFKRKAAKVYSLNK